ncbi:bile acid:sodium symporter [Corynebacterium sp. 320]|uniref:bile acid:sodium symporter family protein n=1 Tax=Corynebacterium TaxID=1716 RepID=UPI00125CD278|nr:MULTISPECIES: bile acid:sodium symporter family protein [Corynebacterium]KAB1502920.1 bile acid:sodium symporter [Corynebacterium sp. 320]KAB1550561.1 bile acid:sodium symporter [Corynebacterium sp. 319]KAB3526583.1 bile acid:sodium symporter [Corynebacterium sp. 250]KAB3540816.1 bile acid:sodium symporter [Corynebacterium sp. 366]QNP93316.1 bile acid:sodium symporter [Corynebacterium zhongnanshanii]
MQTNRTSEPTQRSLLSRILSYRPDLLIVLILAAVALALIVPVRGQAADIANTIVTIAIGFLFFLYGARLSREEAFKGLMHWKLHLLILVFTFVAFPLIGLLLTPLRGLVGDDMFMGILYLCLVPSTVQSSVAFTSIARGHVAASIVAASVSSLAGVFLTPLLVLLLMSTSGGLHIDASTFLKIAVQLLLPFLLGQILRPWVHKFAASPLTKKVDQISIGMVVYVSFSDGVTSGAWSSVSIWTLLGLIVGSVVFVYAMLWFTSTVARRLGFDYRDQVAIQFAGTKKSLASGLPMAAVMFAGANLGLLILPLMIFHQVQLMICSARASKYAKRYEAWERSGTGSPTTW